METEQREEEGVTRTDAQALIRLILLDASHMPLQLYTASQEQQSYRRTADRRVVHDLKRMQGLLKKVQRYVAGENSGDSEANSARWSSTNVQQYEADSMVYSTAQSCMVYASYRSQEWCELVWIRLRMLGCRRGECCVLLL